MSDLALFHSKENGPHPNNSSRYAMLSANMTKNAGNGVVDSLEVLGTADGNDSSACEGLDCYPDVVFETAMVITIILAIFGAVGNLLTVMAIITSRLRQNINSILICHLSFASAIYCLLVLPLQALTFYNKAWTMGILMCELHAALRIWMIGVNMLLLSCIGLYRFLHVVQSQQRTRFSQGCWFALAVITCWALPMVFSITPLLGWWGGFTFQPRILQCTFSRNVHPSHKITTITLGYVIPCIFLLVCYARIGFVVCRSRKRATRGGSQYRKQRARRDSFRLTGMMVLIFLGFLVGTTPFFLINTVDSKLLYPMPHIWSPVLAWVMYGLNPVIYTVMDTQFQQAYRRLLLCQIFKPEHTATAEVSVHEIPSSLVVTKTDKLQTLINSKSDKVQSFLITTTKEPQISKNI